MIYSLPYTVTIDNQTLNIRNNCDFRMILDVIEALNDNELSEQEKIQCALFIFYGDELAKTKNYEEATRQMFIVVNGVNEETEESKKPRLLDWAHDFSQIAPPISRTLGYEIRTPDRYTHWWTFLGGYMEIGECTFSNIISIRSKRLKGQKLEKWEEEFYRENKKMIDLPQNFTEEEREWLDSEW